MFMIHGINPLHEAMKSGEPVIQKLFIARRREGETVKRILKLAEAMKIPIEFTDSEYLTKMTECDSHQGVVGVCESFRRARIDDIIANRHENLNNHLILVLDGITDPRNLGSLIRTAHCFGANGVIIPKDRSASLTAAVMKSSSGALSHIPVAVEVNLSKAIEYLKEKGFWIYGAESSRGQDVRTLNYDCNVAVVMGGEGAGIRPLIKKKCDFLLSIPMMGKIDSLNVSVAAGIILHEVLRAWGKPYVRENVTRF